jgi:hypothetical protein
MPISLKIKYSKKYKRYKKYKKSVNVKKVKENVGFTTALRPIDVP